MINGTFISVIFRTLVPFLFNEKKNSFSGPPGSLEPPDQLSSDSSTPVSRFLTLFNLTKNIFSNLIQEIQQHNSQISSNQRDFTLSNYVM